MRRTLLALAILLVILIVGAAATVAQAWWSCRPRPLTPGAFTVYANQIPVGRATLGSRHIAFSVMPALMGECWQFQVRSSPDDLVHPSSKPTWVDRAAARGPALGWPPSPGTDYYINELRSGWPMRSMLRDVTMTLGSSPAPPAMRAQRLIRDPWSVGPGQTMFTVPTGVVPLGFAVNTAFYSSPIWLPLLVWLIFSHIRRRARLRAGRCPACGYDPGTPTAACPECGHRTGPSATPTTPQGRGQPNASIPSLRRTAYQPADP